MQRVHKANSQCLRSLDRRQLTLKSKQGLQALKKFLPLIQKRMVGYLRDVRGSRLLYHTASLVDWALVGELLFTSLPRIFTQAKAFQKIQLHLFRSWCSSRRTCTRVDHTAKARQPVQPTLQVDNMRYDMLGFHRTVRDRYQTSHHKVIISNDKFLSRFETLGRTTWKMQGEVLSPMWP